MDVRQRLLVKGTDERDMVATIEDQSLGRIQLDGQLLRVEPQPVE